VEANQERIKANESLILTVTMIKIPRMENEVKTEMENERKRWGRAYRGMPGEIETSPKATSANGRKSRRNERWRE
jgi:hypothetical protein